MYSSWISDSWRDRCSETQLARPPSPYISHPLLGFAAIKLTKSTSYHWLDNTRWHFLWNRRCRLLLTSPLTAVKSNCAAIGHPPSTKPTCYLPSQQNHLWRYLFLWVLGEISRDAWKALQILLVLLQSNVHTVLQRLPTACATFIHQIPGVSWVVCFSLTSTYSRCMVRISKL